MNGMHERHALAAIGRITTVDRIQKTHMSADAPHEPLLGWAWTVDDRRGEQHARIRKHARTGCSTPATPMRYQCSTSAVPAQCQRNHNALYKSSVLVLYQCSTCAVPVEYRKQPSTTPQYQRNASAIPMHYRYNTSKVGGRGTASNSRGRSRPKNCGRIRMDESRRSRRCSMWWSQMSWSGAHPAHMALAPDFAPLRSDPQVDLRMPNM